MRRLASLLLLLAIPACGDGASQPPEAGKQHAAAPSSAAESAAGGEPATAPLPGSRLTGRTSSLTGKISDFVVERTEFGTQVQLAADTLFEFDKAQLGPTAQPNLDRTAELVRQGGPGTVTIIGHTDAKGDAAYNMDLSRRRAEAVAVWLRRQPGMNGRDFAAEGRGEAEPVAPNVTPAGDDDAQGRARNRRVTVEIPKRAPGVNS